MNGSVFVHSTFHNAPLIRMMPEELHCRTRCAAQSRENATHRPPANRAIYAAPKLCDSILKMPLEKQPDGARLDVAKGKRIESISHSTGEHPAFVSEIVYIQVSSPRFIPSARAQIDLCVGRQILPLRRLCKGAFAVSHKAQ